MKNIFKIMRKLKQFNQKLEINYKQMQWEIEDKQI